MRPNMFNLLQNGAPIASITYEFQTGIQRNPGLVIITASAGDILTLRNHTSSETVTLQTISYIIFRNSNPYYKTYYGNYHIH